MSPHGTVDEHVLRAQSLLQEAADARFVRDGEGHGWLILEADMHLQIAEQLRLLGGAVPRRGESDTRAAGDTPATPSPPAAWPVTEQDADAAPCKDDAR
jgi:hypothetical protein